MTTQEIKKEIEKCAEACKHNIPFHAFGDNQAACQFDGQLQRLWLELTVLAKKITNDETSLGNSVG